MDQFKLVGLTKERDTPNNSLFLNFLVGQATARVKEEPMSPPKETNFPMVSSRKGNFMKSLLF